jgi:hypothetical protein
MTDPRIDIDAEMQNPDLLLITDYLIGELDPAQVAAVKLRLKEDDAFREYCAPILLAWSVPPRHVRNPMPRVELEKHWDDFTKRAGFVHQRRRARKRWLTILAIVLAIGTGSFFAFKKPVRDWYVDKRDFHDLAYAPGWIPIAEGREVQLAPGARLRLANNENEEGVIRVKLSGTARFRIFSTDSGSFVPSIRPIGVETAAGLAMGTSGEFTVRAVADTTEVEAHRPTRRQFIGFMPMPNFVYVKGSTGAIDFKITEAQSARVVRGGKPVRLP